MRKYFFIIILLIVSNNCYLFAKNRLDYTDGRQALLSTNQIRELTVLKAAIVLPTYIPSGFALKKISSSQSPTANYLAVDYVLIYKNAKGRTFVFQASNDGLGDAPISTVISIKNPVIEGEIDIGRYEDGDKTIGVQWFKAKKQYQPSGVLNSISYSLIDHSDLTIEEVRKIMDSLRILKK